MSKQPRGKACKLEVVSPGEFETCRCNGATVLRILWVPGEEHPRCFECVKPIRDLSVLPDVEQRKAIVFRESFKHGAAQMAHAQSTLGWQRSGL